MEIFLWILCGVLISGIIFAIFFANYKKKKPKVEVNADEAAAKTAEVARLTEEIAAAQLRLDEINKNIKIATDNMIASQNNLNAVHNALTSSLQQKNDALEAEKKAREELDKCSKQVKILTENKALLLTDIATKKAEMAELIENHRQMEMRAAQKDLEHGEVLPLEEWEKEELRELEGIAKRLRNPAPLYKALYEIYYASALKKLVADTGASDKTGIYRLWVVIAAQNDGTQGITSNAPAGTDGSSDVGLQLEKNPVRVLNYVGQAVNIGDRWAQHIKRGLGLDTVGTSVQLYPAMKKYGLENFHWEVLEVCKKEELSERETFWGNYYAVKEVGLNKKLG